MAFLNLMLAEGLISGTQHRLLENYCEKWNVSGFDAALQTHVLTESEIADALAKAMRVDRVYNLAGVAITKDCLSKVPFALARQHTCVPLMFLEGGPNRLEVVFANPLDTHAVSQIQTECGIDIVLAVGERSDILRTIIKKYDIAAQVPSLI